MFMLLLTQRVYSFFSSCWCFSSSGLRLVFADWLTSFVCASCHSPFFTPDLLRLRPKALTLPGKRSEARSPIRVCRGHDHQRAVPAPVQDGRVSGGYGCEAVLPALPIPTIQPRLGDRLRGEEHVSSRQCWQNVPIETVRLAGGESSHTFFSVKPNLGREDFEE